MTLEQLRAELDKMLNPLDIPGDWTQRQRDTYETRRSWLRAKIQDATRATETLADVEPKIPIDAKWSVQLNMWRQTLCDELVALAPNAPTQQNLKLSIKVIDRGLLVLDDTGYVLGMLRLGELMEQSGYVAVGKVDRVWGSVGTLPWFGSLVEVEQRLRDLRQRRDDAQHRLDVVMREVAPPVAV